MHLCLRSRRVPVAFIEWSSVSAATAEAPVPTARCREKPVGRHRQRAKPSSTACRSAVGTYPESALAAPMRMMESASRAGHSTRLAALTCRKIGRSAGCSNIGRDAPMTPKDARMLSQPVEGPGQVSGHGHKGVSAMTRRPNKSLHANVWSGTILARRGAGKARARPAVA